MTMTKVLLTEFNVNYDNDYVYIEGNIQANNAGIPQAFIRQVVFDKAESKAKDIMHTSWIKTGHPGHIPIPDSVLLVLAEDGRIIDLMCLICCENACECHIPFEPTGNKIAIEEIEELIESIE